MRCPDRIRGHRQVVEKRATKVESCPVSESAARWGATTRWRRFRCTRNCSCASVRSILATISSWNITESSISRFLLFQALILCLKWHIHPHPRLCKPQDSVRILSSSEIRWSAGAWPLDFITVSMHGKYSECPPIQMLFRNY